MREIDGMILLYYFTRPATRAELSEPGPAVETSPRAPRPAIAIGTGNTGSARTVRPRPLPPTPNQHNQYFYNLDRYAARVMANNNNAFPALDTSFSSRTPSAAGSQANGAGMNNNMPNYVAAIPVGHQQDLNYLFQQFQELQAQLASNREKVNDITRSAEEVARRANNSTTAATASNGTEGEYDHEADRAKIRELEHATAQLTRLVDLYKHEQRENTSLIAQYEDALGTATEQIRKYCNEIDSKFLSQRRHYNGLLQTEKDEHLQSRLDRDHWHATTLELCGMIRRAKELRDAEWSDEYRVVVGLQTEVRTFRRVLGLEPQRPEEETGYPYLQQAPFNDQA